MLRSRQLREHHVLMLGGMLALIVVGACTSGTGTEPSTGPAASPVAEAPSAAASPPPSSETVSGGGRGDYDYDDPTIASPEASTAPAAATLEVKRATGPLGDYLTGIDGLTLYTFKPDGSNTSTCDGGCAEAWPPLTIAAGRVLEAGDGVDGELTTFPRADGTLQVAYDGAPLYSFANDTIPGDTNGHGLGGNWFVATP